MKKTILSCIAASAIFAVALALVACSEDARLEYSPSLTVSTNAIAVTVAGGPYGFTYSVENSVSGGQVSCETEADWISDLNCASGTVSFSVPENTGANPRMTRVSLVYSYDGESVSQIVTVAQNAVSDVEVQFAVQPTAVTADSGGGTCSFDYSVWNYDGQGTVSCTTSAAWISDFDSSVSGTVNFSVEPNYDTAIREAVVLVYFSYDGGELTETLTVVQDYADSFSIYDFVGTYSCTGIVYNTNWGSGSSAVEPGVEKTWTMKIYTATDGSLILSGLVPDIVEYYPPDMPYIAYGSVLGKNVVVSPQFTGYMGTNYYYICWFVCTNYYTNENAGGYSPGWVYTTSMDAECRFIYDESTKSWTSDYGMFLGLSRTYGTLDIASVYDVFAPGMTFTKISDSTTSSTESVDGTYSRSSSDCMAIEYTDAVPVEILGHNGNF